MENRKTKIISVVAIVALALTVITATYAYFNAQVGDPAAADVKINANTVDTFTFASGSAISFSINQDNFASGAGNQSGSTYASALLTANNKTNTATEHYYLYLNIENNTFTYSINESTPEIIMTVTDSSGTEVTDISTLNHVIVTGANGDQVSGYDITNKNGLITLFNNREITTTSSKEEKWNIKVTFVNYDKNQSANAGKSMSAKVMIQKEPIVTTLASYITNLYTGTQGENGIYYHDASLTNGAGDNSYRYSGDESGVKNYICINSSDATCPDDNLFRIIGVFNGNTKVIKASSYGSTIAWHSKDTGTWADSSLNTTLNSTYLNTYLSEIKNKIVDVTWNVGVLNDSSYTAKNAYTAEISQTYSSAKIGLITVSDYLYTLIPDTWTTSSSSLSNFSSWMSSNENDWTLNIYDAMGSKYIAWVINESGNADGASGYITFKFGYARPVFYLNSTVNYVDGTGISSDPIRIN